jgi:hypothetical protein
METTAWPISMSLDGFVAASRARPEQPLGDGGQRLFEWAGREDRRSREFLAATVDALVVGRRIYDLAVGEWGLDGPSGSLRLPVSVVSHGSAARMLTSGFPW